MWTPPHKGHMLRFHPATSMYKLRCISMSEED